MLGNPQSHERHDRYLVAALAADDLERDVRAEAESLVRSCTDCALLLADLRSIASATHALPPVPRSRDFRITAADAARLRPAGWRALLDAIGGARAAFSRPLAVGLTTLGLVGILATAIPGTLTGGLGSAGAAPGGPEVAAAPTTTRDAGLSNADGAGKASFAPAASAAPAPGSGLAAATAAATAVPSAAATADMGYLGPEASAAPSAAVVQVLPNPSPKAVVGGPSGGKDRVSAGGPADGSSAAGSPAAGLSDLFSNITTSGGSGPAPLLIVSLVCLVAGLGLFAVRWAARRIAGS